MGDVVDYVRLQHLLTAERLGSYMAATGDDIDAAFALYEWNIDVAGAALSLTAMVEVVVRNALDRQMQAWAAARGGEEWFAIAPLDGRGRADIRKATERAARGRKPVTHGHVVAELSFGFWRFLMGRRYLTSLWIPALQHAFPWADADAQQRQLSMEGHAQQLLFLRNRAAHHEPLHRRDLGRDLDRAAALVGAVDATAADWISHKEGLLNLLQARPHHG